jgi:hypothetical protein
VTQDRPAPGVDLLLTQARAARRALHEMVVETLTQRDLALRTAAELPHRPRLTGPQRARFESVLTSAAHTHPRR